MTKKKVGRKKGTTKQKIKERAAAKQAAERPAVEKSDVKLTPWPQAGKNKEFEEILGKAEPPEPAAAKPGEPEQVGLKAEDVAEWVKWPFQLWSTSQNLPPIIQPNEAREIAEPLTRIMNRHGIGEKVPPDVVDGMQVVGRTLPVVKRGNELVKSERLRRAQAGPGKEARQGSTAPQGAPHTKPRET